MLKTAAGFELETPSLGMISRSIIVLRCTNQDLFTISVMNPFWGYKYVWGKEL